MANLSKTRTLFGFTSPRTVEKIIPEIAILATSFNGRKWDTDTQTAFFRELFASEWYEGNKMPKNISLAARDRITRAPKALGFIDLKPEIRLTEVGSRLLSGKRTAEVITRQLLKFQLPSPYHRTPADRRFNVRPYLELLRLVKELGKVSKMEIAIFFLQMTGYEKFTAVADSIKTFRVDVAYHTGNRKEFIDKRFTEEIRKIYKDDIETNNTMTRESSDASVAKFIKTKKSNHIDYADALIRYLRATQLVSFDKKTYRLIIAPSRVEEVEFILKHVERHALEATEQEYKAYLFDPASLSLLTDNRRYLENRLKLLGARFDQSAGIDSLKDLLEATEQRVVAQSIHETEVSLKEYKEFDNITEVFQNIVREEVPDPSLYLEWNVWRSMVMINYAREIKGNFSIDLDGVPLNIAMGNMPDIEITYEHFKLIIEVTMSAGNKQYEMEGEPVSRHFGNVQKNTSQTVFCLFVAPKISEGALAHFFNLNKMNTRAYGGKTRIIPMNLTQFIRFVSVAREYHFNDSKNLQDYFDTIIDQNGKADDEIVWSEYIANSVSSWVRAR